MTREEFARREYELGYMIGVKLAKGEIKLADVIEYDREWQKRKERKG